MIVKAHSSSKFRKHILVVREISHQEPEYPTCCGFDICLFSSSLEHNNRGSAKANDKKMLRSDVMDLHQNNPVRLA